MEAIYRFPLPENATVIGIKMLLDGKTIKGVIEEKNKAFETYDDALIKGNGAVLFDQERPNIFTLSVGNLNPGSKVSIEIEYISVLDFRDDILQFFLPMTISPRYVPSGMQEDDIPTKDKIHPEYAAAVSYGIKIQIKILKAHGMDLASISSPSHKIKTTISDLDYLIEFTAREAKMDRDFVLEVEYKKSNKNNAFYIKGQDESFIQVDFTPDLEVLLQGNNKDFLTPKRNIVFVLDCSGSMTGSSIMQAKKALEVLIRALEPKQKFNIYRFGSYFENLSDNFLEFSDITLNLALDFLDSTDASFGGTEILGPLKDILSKKIKNTEPISENKDGDISKITNIVLITDGEVGNEDEIINLVKLNKQHFRVFTVGIGYGPNEYFIKDMAKSTGGYSIMVHPEERIDLKVISLFKNLNKGAIEDLRIDLGTDEKVVEQAPEIVTVFGNSNYSIYAKIKKEFMPENITLKGIFSSQEVSWNIPIVNKIDKDEKTNSASNYIPKFWAREKIKDLESSSFKTIGSQQMERKKRNIENLIIDLSKKYGIVSSKTSFVCVEERDEKEKTTGEVSLIKIPTLITKGWHGLDAGKFKTSAVWKDEEKINRKSVFLKEEIHEAFFMREFDDVCDYTTSYLVEIGQEKKNHLRDNIVLEILSCQVSGGGFKISNKLAKLLKISKEEIEKLIGLVRTYRTGIDTNKKRQLVETALILAILQKYFKSSIDTWGSIVEKSKSWLNKMPYSQIEGKPLMAYISEYIENLSL